MKILVTGPESAGKSTLARGLAWVLDGIYVEEQARSYLHARGGHYTAEDLPRILAQQLSAERQAVALNSSFVLCDTGAEVIRVWSEVKYGGCDPFVLNAFHDSSYDLTLLCAPDIPWAHDKLRESRSQEEREALFHRYRSILPNAIIIDEKHRLERALSIVIDYSRRSGAPDGIT